MIYLCMYAKKILIRMNQDLIVVGSDGFEPPKLEAADLQSAPFGHSGNYPNLSGR